MVGAIIVRYNDSRVVPVLVFSDLPSYLLTLKLQDVNCRHLDLLSQQQGRVTKAQGLQYIMSHNIASTTAMDEKGEHGAYGIEHAAREHHRVFDYGGNPLVHANAGDTVRLPAFGGEFQPGLYKSPATRKFANPAPLGLSAFALTTFLLSLINTGSNGITEPHIVIAAAFAYGGLVQLTAGMW